MWIILKYYIKQGSKSKHSTIMNKLMLMLTTAADLLMKKFLVHHSLSLCLVYLRCFHFGGDDLKMSRKRRKKRKRKWEKMEEETTSRRDI